eukprot:379117_1
MSSSSHSIITNTQHTFCKNMQQSIPLQQSECQLTAPTSLPNDSSCMSFPNCSLKNHGFNLILFLFTIKVMQNFQYDLMRISILPLSFILLFIKIVNKNRWLYCIFCILSQCNLAFTQNIVWSINNQYYNDNPVSRTLTIIDITETVNEINATVTWKDQGWGYRKGKIYMKIERGGTQIASINLFGSAQHELENQTISSVNCQLKDLYIGNNDKIILTAYIGGGGGHTLTINLFEFYVYYGPYTCPTWQPTTEPTSAPTFPTTASPTPAPSVSPTIEPTTAPTTSPTEAPLHIYTPTQAPILSNNTLYVRKHGCDFGICSSDSMDYNEICNLNIFEIDIGAAEKFCCPNITEFPTAAPTFSPTDTTVSPTTTPTISSEAPTTQTFSPTIPPSYSPTTKFPTLLTTDPTFSPTKSTISPTTTPTTTSPSKSPSKSPTKTPIQSPTYPPSITPTTSPIPVYDEICISGSAHSYINDGIYTYSGLSSTEQGAIYKLQDVYLYPWILSGSYYYLIGTDPTDIMVYGYSTISKPSGYIFDITDYFSANWVYYNGQSFVSDSNLIIKQCNTQSPSNLPTKSPTPSPTYAPTHVSLSPSQLPSKTPSHSPSIKPTTFPTTHPSFDPTLEPTIMPSQFPTLEPTFNPS